MATVELRNAYGIALEGDADNGLTRLVTDFLSLMSMTMSSGTIPKCDEKGEEAHIRTRGRRPRSPLALVKTVYLPGFTRFFPII
jgi:hypothetical protein